MPTFAVVAEAKTKPQPSKESLVQRARAALLRKRHRTPLEDALAGADGGQGVRSVELCRFARTQFQEYYGALGDWRQSRTRYMAEGNDIFEHRIAEHRLKHDGVTDKPVFSLRNDSLNVVGSMCEFATAQAGQDLFGGEPWFATKPVGRADEELSDQIAKWARWKTRDGALVNSFEMGVTLAGICGEAFTLTGYERVVEEFERPVTVLCSGNQPCEVDGKRILATDWENRSDEELRAFTAEAGLKGPFKWLEVFETQTVVSFDAVDRQIIHHHDVAFREGAPELDLRFTNFYVIAEMSVGEAMRKFNLNRTDALRLALAAGVKHSSEYEIGKDDAILDANPTPDDEHTYGSTEEEMLLNSRLRLVHAWMRVDPFGKGRYSSIYCVFPPNHEDWLVYADYLGNMTPNGILPAFCHTWERVPHRLYGKGFFEKYRGAQRYIDDLYNQIGYRNAMHANPVTGIDRSKLDDEEEDQDVKVAPGESLTLRKDQRLAEAIQFLALPDMDNRSMELLQITLQMVQLRAGITSASQGDVSSVPENQTATGIRQLMSRAAVLLKKPIRNLRRSHRPEFTLVVKLMLANLNVDQAFVWGEGEAQELITLAADKVRDLDVDVELLLTQEQNATKLEGSQAAIQSAMQWIQAPEIEKTALRPLFLQAIKALEFERADEIIRKAAPTLIDAISLLPKDQQQQALAIMQAGEQALAAAQQPQNVQPMPAEQQAA